jgi:hypothetical protein
MTATAAARVGRTLDVLAVTGVVAWVGAAVAVLLVGGVPWPDSIVDYAILYRASRQVVSAGTYPPGYPYPPSAAVLHYASAVFSFPVSATLWLIVTTTSALGCWALLARLLDLGRRPGQLLLLLLAQAAASSFLVWDLRSQNCNVVFLAALLLGVDGLRRQRPLSAGFWLALSFSLKLFSILCLPYLLWTGRRRELAWTLGFIGFFWAVLPILLIGPGGTVRAYGDWRRQLAEASNAERLLAHPIVISLHGSAAWLADGDTALGWVILNGMRGLWAALFLTAWLLTRGRNGGAYGLLTDVSVLTLAPIAVSPYLEPYHPVPYAIAALLLLHAAVDGSRTRRQRRLAALLFAASLAVGMAPLDWKVRGLVVSVKLLLAVGGCVLLARLGGPSDRSAAVPWPQEQRNAA